MQHLRQSGPVAQLGARFHGMEEVVGSIPTRSTKVFVCAPRLRDCASNTTDRYGAVQAQIKFGRLKGIEIGLHYSWFIIAILIALSLSAHFHALNPGWSMYTVWGAALITAVLFFGALLLHELAHSMVAQSRGLKVRAITLFALGGVSQIEEEAQDAKSEFWIAIVGPITSAVIGLLFILGARLSGLPAGREPATPVLAVLLWLGYINVALAVFNMIPGYPLDGGRVLRAIAWWITGQADRAMRIAARIGQGVALLFILFGLFEFFVGASFGGLWIAFIGWFLLDAARGSYLQVEVMSDLRGRRVADIMVQDCDPVEGYLNLRDFVDHHLLHSSSRCFPVVQGEHVTGLITPNEVRKVNREDWETTSVQSVMLPLGTLRSVSPDTPAIKALEMMAREDLEQVVVLSNGRLQGIFSRGQVARFLRVHAGQAAKSHDAAA
jgi:Zn-dependent protease/CBS domain-containing protein